MIKDLWEHRGQHGEAQCSGLDKATIKAGMLVWVGRWEERY